MTPAEEMRAAARKLREATYAVPDGPWGVTEMRDHTYGVWTTGTGFSGEDDQVASANIEPVAAWIALMGPDKAEPLAAWLAITADCTPHGFVHSVEQQAAVAFARAILGAQA